MYWRSQQFAVNKPLVDACDVSCGFVHNDAGITSTFSRYNQKGKATACVRPASGMKSHLSSCTSKEQSSSTSSLPADPCKGSSCPTRRQFCVHTSDAKIGSILRSAKSKKASNGAIRPALFIVIGVFGPGAQILETTKSSCFR